MSTSRAAGRRSLRGRRDHRRELKEHVVRALAKVGLLWSLALLWFVFSAMAAQGSEDAALTANTGATTLSFVNLGEAPRTSGLVLALSVLVGGLTVLVWGSLRGAPAAAPEPEPVVETGGGLELALGLGLAPYRATA